MPLVHSNIKALKYMQSMYSVAELLSNAAERMLEKVELWSAATLPGQNIIPDEPYPGNETERTEHSAPGTPVQSAPDYVLNPLSIYRMARKAIPERHETLQSTQRQSIVSSDGPDGVTSLSINSNVNQADQQDLDSLLSLFSTDPSGWTWQPSDTAFGSQHESNGLPPWETYVDSQLDAWVPMFSSQTQSYGFQ